MSPSGVTMIGSARWWMAGLVLAGCGSKDEGTVPTDETDSDADTDSDTDSDTDTDTDADTDTDTDTDADTDTGTVPTGYAQPTQMDVSCVATANVLRWDCTVTVDPPQPVEIAWARVDGLSVGRTRASGAVSDAHLFTVLFLAPQTDYTVDAWATAWPASPVGNTTFTTAAMPAGSGSGLAMTGTSTMGLIGTETPCDTRAMAVIYDTATGELVWYQDLDPGGELGMLDMVRFTDEMTVIGETQGKIVEVDVYGNDLVRFPVSYPGCCSLNHDIFKSPDGEYWSQYQDIAGGLTLDDIVVIDATGVEVWRWEPEDFLTIPADAGGDWLHTNSEYVDANGDFYLSWLTRDAVGKFVGDRALPNAGERIWVMTGDGRQGELGNDITLDWTGISLPHEFGGQHNFHGTHDGRLMLLDNDHGRGLVISVDEATRTGTVDEEYETRESQCFAQGTAMDTHAGNAVVACATPWVREYDQGGTAPIWEAEIQCVGGGGGGFTSGAATRWYPLDSWQ